jgi:hypothetical protein
MHALLRVLGFALLLAFALLALAPAAILQPVVERAGGGALTLLEAQGTLWTGTGALAAGGQRLPLSWQVRMPGLLRGVVAVQLGASDAARAPVRGLVTLSPRGVAATDAEIRVPAAMLVAIARPGAPLHVSGEITATVPRLERHDAEFAGTAALRWRSAGIHPVSGGPALDLGTVAASLRAAGDRLAATIDNEGGDVHLQGEASVGFQGAPTLDLRVTPRGAIDSSAAALLHAVGRPEGEGWRITWPAPVR